jgi:hypothetical protein
MLGVETCLDANKFDDHKWGLMCELFHPVFRLGNILKSSAVINRSQGLRVAKRLVENSSAIVVRSFERASSTLTGIRLCHKLSADTLGEALSKKSPLIVVDFPVVKFSIDGFLCESRSCVTVCTNEKKSKCWTRVISLNGERTAEKEDAFFDLSEKLCEELNASIIASYREAIVSELKESFENNDFVLKSDYKLKSRIVSTDDVIVDGFCRDVFAYGQSADDAPEAMAEISAIMRQIDDSVPTVFATSADIKVKQRIMKKGVRRLGVTSTRYAASVDDPFETELVSGVFTLSFDKICAKFVGVGFDPIARTVRPTKSVSQVLSIQLANEYGSLY